MLKRIRWWKIVLIAGALPALWLILWSIGHFAGTHRYRLVAHYSARDAPTVPPEEYMKDDPGYQRYIKEGRPAIFTESGLFLYEKGGDPCHTKQEEAVIAKRDWAGRRRWSVTLPECEWRSFSASPNGEYLATVSSTGWSTLVEVWRDGKLEWDWPARRFYWNGTVHINNEGRMIYWYEGQVVMVEEGEKIGANDNLPRAISAPNLHAQYQLSPDGSALFGLLEPRRLDGNYYRPTAPPSLEYLALTIRGGKVVPVRKFKVPNASEGWELLSDGSVVFTDGTLYSPEGKKGGEPGWQTYPNINRLILSVPSIGVTKYPVIGGEDQGIDSILWHGDIRIQYKGAPADRYRIYLPHSGRSIPIAADIVTDQEMLALQPSEDGRYLLAVNPVLDFPPSAAGALARRLAAKGLMSEKLKLKLMESIRFELYEPAGKKRAVLSGRFTPDGKPYIAAAKNRYQPINTALSPDGRHLVILAERVDSNIREYLHFAW